MKTLTDADTVALALRMLDTNQLTEISQLQTLVRDVTNARHNLGVARSTNESSHIENMREKTLEYCERNLAKQIMTVFGIIENKTDL